MADTDPPLPGNSIAVVGMSGRFPGARSIDELWRNLVAGVESVTRFTDEELRASGISPSLVENPDYVKVRGLIDGPELFDAPFFGISHREAELMDPQQRLFLETCWLALEHAGIAPSTFSGPIGVWGGMSTGMTNNTYLLSNLHSQPGLLEAEDVLPAMLGNENDYLTTRVSYKLNLRGPSVNVQSACSTSLVAIAQAVQALLTWQCDAALAGGVSVSYPQRDGYLFQEGGIGSPDGHCRAFDAEAQGTVFSNGVGVVVLRRLEDALADRQPIYAVIRGAAINNDGSAKVSFAAPSVEGQADVIATAHAIADVLPDSIGYVEAHGTGTPLGDPIEVTALTKAFRAGGATGRQFCALGSVKSNFGHLDSAAGVTGFIKAVLALHHGKIPPTLHFREPNPRLKLPESPFYVNAEAREWARGDRPRRAGVSSFGIGGTNAHVVLEEAPAPAPAADDDAESVLLVLSAKTETAVREAGTRLADAFAADSSLTLADAAYTLQMGRQAMTHRRAYVCGGRDEAIALLRGNDTRRVISGVAEQGSRSMAFLFPGGGTQYVQMGRDLLTCAPVFREEIERCLAILRPSRDLRPVLFAAADELAEAMARLEQPSWGLPALFAVEYAVARQWMAWGVTPDALIGHSMGEYTAACLAGVMSLEDALAVVLLRGRLFETLAPGEMVGVPLSEAEVLPRLGRGLAIAAVNAPSSCVVSGPPEALAAFAAAMEEDDVECRRLHIAVAAHSPMVEPILREFEQFFHGIQLQPPSIPVVSNVTGTWMTADEACSPEYWARHLRQTVRFFDGLGVLMREPNRVLLECGPGQTLSGFVRQHPEKIDAQLSQASLRHPKDATPDIVFLQQAVGRLWTAGVPIDWTAFTEGQECRRVVLPPYAFDRKRYLIEPSLDRSHASSAISSAPLVASHVVSEAAPPTQARTIVMSHHSNPVGPTPSAPPVAVRSRADRICDRLTELLHKLSGLPVGEIDPNVSFLEMGFDSLFLTQASLRFKNEFKVRIGFRQLFEDAPTLSALAGYIDGKLSPDAFPAPAAAAPAAMAQPVPVQAAPAQSAPAMTPAMVPAQPSYAVAPAYAPAAQVFTTPANASAVERVIQQQLQVMAEQLRALGTPVSAFAPLAGAVSPQAVVMPEAIAVPAPVAPASVAAAPAAAAAAPETAKAEPQGYGRFRPIDRSNAPSLSPAQQRALDAWIARYTKRTAGSKRVTAGNRPSLADPRSVAGFNRLWKEMIYPIVSERSEGSKIWDVDGNEYVDMVMGYGSNLFGHRPPFIQDAVEAQLKQGFEIGPLQPVVGDVARLVSELTGMERVGFTNTGSEAVLVATRVARTVTGRERIAVFDGSYHGVFDEMLLRHGPTNRNAAHTPAAPGVPASAVSQVIVMDYNDPAASLATLREHGDEIAAVLVEPVQSRRLDLQPRDFMHELRRVTNEIGAALIFDEVITGFRSHPGGAQAYFGVRADIATYGKVVGGGLPIGVVAGSSAYLDALDGGAWQFGDASFPEVGVTYFAGTFVRHPLALASARAVLTHLKENPTLQQSLATRTSALADRLRATIRQYNAPLKLTNFSSIMHLSAPPDQRYAGLLFYLLRDYGIHIWEGFPLFITTAHTDADFDLIAHALDRSLAEMRAAGFFGDAPPDDVPPSGGRKTAAEPAVVPFTQSQLEIYIGSGMSEASSRSFNEVVALDVKGPLDIAAMQKALSQVVARHESLRMTVSAEPLGFTLADRVDVPLEYEDVSSLPPAERNAAVDALMRSGDSVTFDLTRGPLLRLTLMKTAADAHLFVLVAHHLVCDGLSFGIVLRDLYACYSALVTGGVPDLPEPVSAVAFAHDATEPEQVETRAEAERFWVSKFATLPDPLELPADRPRPAVRSYDGERIALTLRPEVARAVKALATGQRATMFTTLLAGFVTLISRLSGQDDFVIGIPVAGQSMLENQELVAHCVSFVPLRCRAAKDATFLTQLAAARQQSLDINEYHNFTYGSLLNQLRLPRDPSRDPLVTISFTVEPPIDNLAFHGLTATMRTVPRTTAKRDLHVNVTDTADGLLVEADFNRGMYDRATVARWLESYGHLLEAAVAAPDAPIAQLAMLSAGDRDRVLSDWNATRAAYPSDRLVHQMVEAHAARIPKALALVHEQQRLTWRELNARANQIARALVRTGVGSGTIVGICLERSADFIASLMAAHKAGAAYVPLDPAYPSERLAFLLGDARVAATITHTALAARVPAPGPVVLLGGADDAAARESTDNLDRPVDLDALAYVIYTSGSTGAPKGVAVPHRQLLNYVHAINERLALPADAGYALVSTVAADLGMTSIYPPLSTGGVIHVVTSDRATDARALASYLAAERVDVLKITPSHLDALLQQHRTADLLPARCLVIAGEVARASWVAELRALAPHCKIVNSYGPTETTVGAMTHQADRPAMATGDWLPIGTPMGNVRVYVLDAGGALAPIGIPGELFIGGAGVARGYLHREELTAQRFVRDPFVSDAEARMYRTGDRVRWLADGTMEFLGRVDHQIKIRGYRVELGEIESTLRTHQAVEDVVAVLREDVPGDPRVVAYVRGRAVDAAELRAHAKRSLPEHAIPAVFVALESFPLTPNGKIDRKALPAPALEEAAAAAGSVAVEPSTPVEKKLAAMWTELLSVKHVGLRDDFFLLGGHSLLAMRLVGRLHKEFGVALAPGALFQYSTLIELATYVESRMPAPAPAAASPAATAPRSTPNVPTTPRAGLYAVPSPVSAPKVSSGGSSAAALLDVADAAERPGAVVTTVIDMATRTAIIGSAPVLHAVTAEETAVAPDMFAPRRLPQKVLVQLATGGQGLPFFWVHGVGGEVFSYLQLSRHLAANRPVYGFTADWSQIAGERMPTLEEMAAAYVAEMRVVQPYGPYFIGGFCSAAMLALEVARQLEAQHQKVGLLAAIDYDLVPVETSPKGMRAIAAFLRNVPRWVREDAMASGPKELLGRLRSKLRGWRRASSRDKSVDVRDQFGMWRFPDYQVAMLKAHHQAIHSYRPKSLNGHVALFLPRTAPLLGPWPKGHGAEWDHIARGGVEVHRVRGSHATLLREPFVEALGKCLNACIEQVECGPGEPPARASRQSTTPAVVTAMTAVTF